MSFLYPRVIAITREPKQTGEGALSYGGRAVKDEVPVVSGVRCSIQARRDGQRNPVGLPADGTKTTWYIFIPNSAGVAKGIIKDRDMVTDDTGERYQVVANYWDSLGYRLTTEKMEA